MIRQLRYVNSRGQEISFLADKGPLLLGKTDIFDMERDYSAIGGTIVGFDAGIREASLAVLMREGDAGLHDRFVDVVSYDLAVGRPGRLWAGKCWLRCWISGFELSEWGYYDSMCTWDCTVLTDRPAWVREETVTLTARDDLEIGGLDYPHDYPHDYLYSAGASVTLTNPYSLPAKCDIAVAGPCRHPYLIVGANRYQVLEDVDAGQLLLIRGFGGDGKRDIVVRHRDGTERSVFAKGVRDPRNGADVFAEIPPGKSVASWSGSYNVELKLYEERTSPCWA